MLTIYPRYCSIRNSNDNEIIMKITPWIRLPNQFHVILNLAEIRHVWELVGFVATQNYPSYDGSQFYKIDVNYYQRYVYSF